MAGNYNDLTIEAFSAQLIWKLKMIEEGYYPLSKYWLVMSEEEQKEKLLQLQVSFDSWKSKEIKADERRLLYAASGRVQ